MLIAISWIAFLGIGAAVWFGFHRAMGPDRTASSMVWACLVMSLFYGAVWFVFTAFGPAAMASVAVWGGVLAPPLLLLSIVAALTGLARNEDGARWWLLVPLCLGLGLLSYFAVLWVSLQMHT